MPGLHVPSPSVSAWMQGEPQPFLQQPIPTLGLPHNRPSSQQAFLTRRLPLDKNSSQQAFLTPSSQQVFLKTELTSSKIVVLIPACMPGGVTHLRVAAGDLLAETFMCDCMRLCACVCMHKCRVNRSCMTFLTRQAFAKVGAKKRAQYFLHP